MQTIVFYTLALGLLGLSAVKDKAKTQKALIKAWKSFFLILPDLFGIMILVGFILALTNPQQISLILGKESGFIGMLIASIIGSITLIPGFVAFPLTAGLLKCGAGYPQLAVFISTLMMVGVITIPVEMKYFGKKVALFRNLYAYFFSFIVAFIIGVML